MRILPLAFAVLLPASFAHAGDDALRRHNAVFIGGGGKGRIAYFGVPGKSCETVAMPEISIVERPSYGKLLLRSEWKVAFDWTIPPYASDCTGRYLDVTSVFYDAAPGFYGSDRVVLRVDYPAADGRPAETVFSEIYVRMR